MSPYLSERKVCVMSATEILNELPKLSLAERQAIAQKLAELETRAVDFRARGMDERAVAELRARLAPFAEDWDSPEMSAYDHYHAAKANL